MSEALCVWRNTKYGNPVESKTERNQTFDWLITIRLFPDKDGMATITSARRQNPNDFLKLIIGRPVVVKLNSGKGEKKMACALKILRGTTIQALSNFSKYFRRQDEEWPRVIWRIFLAWVFTRTSILLLFLFRELHFVAWEGFPFLKYVPTGTTLFNESLGFFRDDEVATYVLDVWLQLCL